MIAIQNLSFGYNRKKLLYKNLTLSLEAGSIYGLLGKNGAGKSTLLKNIIGLLFPTGGSISVNNFISKKRQPSFLKLFIYTGGSIRAFIDYKRLPQFICTLLSQF